MSLSFREKQELYDHLGKLLRAGVPIKGALDKLALTAGGSMGRMINRLHRQLESGSTLADAFLASRQDFSDFERATLAGLARSGQMEAGLRQLSEYFAALHRARSEVLRGLAYPIFLLHFGVLSLNAPLVVSVSWEEYLRRTGFVFLLFYGALAAAAILIPLVRDAGSFLPPVDDLLRRVPFVGKPRRSFALARFCATYNMQLDAGINVMEALKAAALASRSALIRSSVARALPGVRRGEQVGPLLARSSSAFSKPMMRAFLVAEETGQLDKTLHELNEEFTRDAFTRMQTASKWLPQLFYIAVLLYFGWKVISGYKDGIDDAMRQIDAVSGQL